MNIMRTQRPLLQRPYLWGVLLLAIPVLVTGRTGGTLRAAPAPAPKPPGDIGVQAGLTKYLADPRMTALSEGIQFTQDDAVMKTDHATALHDKDGSLLSADAPGPVHLYDPQDDLTGQHGTIDFTSHLAKLSGDVILRVTPGKREAEAPDGSPRRQFKDPATVTCALMTYDYRRKVGKIPGPLTVRQIIQRPEGALTRTLTADTGLYSGRAQTILLAGTVKGEDSDGNVINADTRASGKPIVIGIKEGSEYLSVPFKTNGRFKVKPQADDGKEGGDGLDEVPPVPPAPVSPSGSVPNTITNIAPPAPASTPATPPATVTPPASAPPATGTAPPAPAGTGKP